MQGIEILTSAQVVTEYLFCYSVFWITFGIIFGTLFIIGIVQSIKDDDWDWLIFLGFIGFMLGLMCGVAGGSICQTPISHETQYKVTISDEVSMTEFCEHYEVIEQDGKIFTVRERDNNG